MHRIVYSGGRYAYLFATPEGFDERIWVVLDPTDPTDPVEAGRWWWPGQWVGGGERAGWPWDGDMPRTTRCSTVSGRTSATTTRTWSCSTSPTRVILGW